jgi:hypothetical protein
MRTGSGGEAEAEEEERQAVVDPATLTALAMVLKELGAIIGPFLAGWFLPQPKRMRNQAGKKD